MRKFPVSAGLITEIGSLFLFLELYIDEWEVGVTLLEASWSCIDLSMITGCQEIMAQFFFLHCQVPTRHRRQQLASVIHLSVGLLWTVWLACIAGPSHPVSKIKTAWCSRPAPRDRQTIEVTCGSGQALPESPESRATSETRMASGNPAPPKNGDVV